MKRIHKDQMSRAKTGFKLGMGMLYKDTVGVLGATGTFIFDLRDAKTGQQLHYFEKKNIITLDAGIQAARLFKDKDEPDNSITMLAIGTGATGSILSPDAPDSAQRKLNAEIARKGFVSTTFRDSVGAAVSYPTNVVDFTTTYGEAEAVGALTEMGLICPVSDNPLITNPNPETFPTRTTTLDITPYDVLINYLTFPVVSKPSTAILTITWRLSF